MVRVELVIGLIGGIIGLLMTPLNFILGIVIAALTLGTFAQLLILTGMLLEWRERWSRAATHGQAA